MSRAVRMVPPDWQHPMTWRRQWSWEHGCAVGTLVPRPLLARSYADDLAEFAANPDDWEDLIAPDPDDYMPVFPEGTATHYAMYEETSEGTPISPAFATIEELAFWLADNRASAFGGMTATYEQWLAMCRQGWAPSAVQVAGGPLMSGVEAFS